MQIEREALPEIRLDLTSISCSNHEIKLLHEYKWKRNPVISRQRLSPETMQGLTRQQKINLLKKSCFAAADSGKRSTFMGMYYFILELLEEENPKLAASLALDLCYGNHRTQRNQIPNYKFCAKLIKKFSDELTPVHFPGGEPHHSMGIDNERIYYIAKEEFGAAMN
jgi:hypothetical protein